MRDGVLVAGPRHRSQADHESPLLFATPGCQGEQGPGRRYDHRPDHQAVPAPGKLGRIRSHRLRRQAVQQSGYDGTGNDLAFLSNRSQAFFKHFRKKIKPEKTQRPKKLNDFSGQNSTNR